MANKIYVGDIGLEIIIDMQTDISDATTYDMLVYKDGVEVTWVAAIYETNYLRYVTEADDLDIVGVYRIQGSLAFEDGWSGRSETVTFRVLPKWKQ